MRILRHVRLDEESSLTHFTISVDSWAILGVRRNRVEHLIKCITGYVSCETRFKFRSSFSRSWICLFRRRRNIYGKTARSCVEILYYKSFLQTPYFATIKSFTLYAREDPEYPINILHYSYIFFVVVVKRMLACSYFLFG